MTDIFFHIYGIDVMNGILGYRPLYGRGLVTGNSVLVKSVKWKCDHKTTKILNIAVINETIPLNTTWCISIHSLSDNMDKIIDQHPDFVMITNNEVLTSKQKSKIFDTMLEYFGKHTSISREIWNKLHDEKQRREEAKDTRTDIRTKIVKELRQMKEGETRTILGYKLKKVVSIEKNEDCPACGKCFFNKQSWIFNDSCRHGNDERSICEGRNEKYYAFIQV